ncbi:MAG: heavy metal-associated domain-containing protein [Nanoarchaeota archaeon]|nr:heavy metal-associated domain-containing protein [Nanoarchaeota archaeon]
MKKLKITIQGMHCASCAANIEKAVSKIKGVKSVSVSIMTNKGFVEAEDNLNPEEIKKTVDKIGYKVIIVTENKLISVPK